MLSLRLILKSGTSEFFRGVQWLKYTVFSGRLVGPRNPDDGPGKTPKTSVNSDPPDAAEYP